MEGQSQRVVGGNAISLGQCLCHIALWPLHRGVGDGLEDSRPHHYLTCLRYS